jgi:hypothetical protein
VLVAENGGRAASYREEDGARVMQQAEIAVRVDLARGEAPARGVDLRLFLRLRQDQRRLPQLIHCTPVGGQFDAFLLLAVMVIPGMPWTSQFDEALDLWRVPNGHCVAAPFEWGCGSV